MNWLAHFWLARETNTSLAGQLLGDSVKGEYRSMFTPGVANGIRLHRAIDSFTDCQPEHIALRREFAPPLRRYAGILVDIGFDHALARRWHRYSSQPLHEFTDHVESVLLAEWPDTAPTSAGRLVGMGALLAGYRHRDGIAHALSSVSRRLRRANPVAASLPAVMDKNAGFERRLPALLERTRDYARRTSRQPTSQS